MNAMLGVHFNGALYATSAIAQAHTKEDALGELSLMQFITDLFGLSNHEKIVSLLFDIAHPKSSDSFQTDVSTLSTLVDDEHKESFKNSFRLELDQSGWDSKVIIKFGEIVFSETIFVGKFEFCDRLFENQDGKYKTKELSSELRFLVNTVRDRQVWNQRKASFVDIVQSVFGDYMRGNLFEQLPGDIARCAAVLPEINEDGEHYLTKADWIERISRCFDTKGDVSTETLPDFNVDNDQVSASNVIQKLREKTRGLIECSGKYVHDGKNMSIEDKALFVSMASQTISPTMYGIRNDLEAYQPQPGETVGSYNFAASNNLIQAEIMPSTERQIKIMPSTERQIKIMASTSIDFSLQRLDVQNGIPKFEIDPKVATQKTSNIYTNRFSENGSWIGIDLEFRQFEFTINNENGTPPPVCLVRSTNVNPKFRINFESANQFPVTPFPPIAALC